jgi:amidase
VADLHDLTALEQGAAIRRGEISPAELVEHYLARIDAHAASLGAFVTVTDDQARAAAVEAAAVARAGSAASPLEGVPTAIKDLTLTAGVRTTFGSAAFADFVPKVDADVVTLMRHAGLISLGKTATSEFGCSLYCETEIGPPGRNPWAPRYTCGGSSGGAAAAVAAGLVPIAHGNDGGGSLRIPGSICGVVGFKPSRGVVSSGPLGYGGFGLPTNGPLARTVADAAALLDVMAVPIPGEPFGSPVPPTSFLDAARHPEAYLPKDRPLRVGRYAGAMLAQVTPDPDVLAVWEETSAALVALGWEVVDVDPPLSTDLEPHFEAVWRVLSLSPVPPELEPKLLPLTRWLRENGRAVPAERLVMALAELQVRVRQYARRTPRCDLWLSPVLSRAQAPVGWFTAQGDPAEDFNQQARFSPYCAVYNLTGQPAVSLPVGQAADGAPIGVMLAAALGADPLLMAASAMVEAAIPWSDRHPAIWSS